MVNDGMLTVDAAAKFLSLSRTTIYDMMESGDLPYVKFGRSRRVPRRALIEAAAGALVTR